MLHLSLIFYYTNNECNPKLRLVGIHISQQFNRQKISFVPIFIAIASKRFDPRFPWIVVGSSFVHVFQFLVKKG
jgi:hypothetical protein